MRSINTGIRKAVVTSIGVLLALVLRRGCLRIILWLARPLYQLTIRGAEHLPSSGAFLIVGPVASLLDGLGLLFLKSVRPDLRGLGTCRWVTRSPQPDLATPWAHVALRWLQEGYPVATAPEGGIRWDGRSRPLKPGAAWLALHAHVPVVVLVVKGGYDIWPRWASLPRLRGKLTIRVGKPLYLADGPQARVDETMLGLATEKIAREIARLEHHDP